ncbi:hypothetical protein dqs_0636 [Azoarcus olearius]|uniref:hypothetical protein n=1 Tax=Azoarcus sp. (strain BH72) TaxID=418699 RepID=UPI00080631F2|nr:hypothetical protein [Azoarcus olearius]ANQ83712.1 hypothetical protein dqs_0636 [Azoarcus olearius]
MSGIPASPMADALKAFVDRNKGWKQIADAIPVGPRPGTVSTGRPSTTPGSSTGGGSFVESDYTLRQYHAKVVKETTDGVFTFEIEPIKRVQGYNDQFQQYEPPPAE